MILYVVGFGSGSRCSMTAEAEQAISDSTLIVGYQTYVEIMRGFFPEKEYRATGMRQETARVREALEAAQYENTALVCSGDPELYGMAGLAYQLRADYPDVIIQVVPGVSAAFTGGALLGAPLTHDFAVISLSDLLTSPETIRKRLCFAAEADFVIVLYNPSSKHRPEHLMRACDLILQYRSPETVCGYVRNIGREDQSYRVLTLMELRDTQVDMFTTVFIGNSETMLIDGKMVTPRGYQNV